VKPHPDYCPIKDWEYSHLPLDKGGIHPDEEKEDGQPVSELLPPSSKREAGTAR